MMSLNKLLPISLGVGVACYGMAELHTRAFSEYIKKCKFFIEAIDTFKSHHGAIHFLGEPIECSNPSYISSSFFFNGFCNFEVRVKGPKNSGVLFVTAMGEDYATLKLDTVQLQLKNDKSRRLIIKESESRNIGS